MCANLEWADSCVQAFVTMFLVLLVCKISRFSISRLSRWDYQNSNIAAASGFGNLFRLLLILLSVFSRNESKVGYGFWAVLEFGGLWMQLWKPNVMIFDFSSVFTSHLELYERMSNSSLKDALLSNFIASPSCFSL